MITKRNFIDLLRNRLAGGTSPQDIDKLYPYGVVSKLVNSGIADIVTQNRASAEQMALEYEFTPLLDDKGYYVELIPKPINGTLSIFLIEDESKTYNIQTRIMAKTIQTLRGHNKDGAVYGQGKIRFKKKPTGNVFVLQVPNVYEMDDNDMLMPQASPTEAGELAFFTMLLQVLKTPEYQDNLNNNAIDAQQR